MHPPSPKSTEALDLRLLVAGIEELDAGFTVFDADLKLVAANARFREMLGFPPALCTPGTPFGDFLRNNAERGEYGAGDIDQLVAERLELARRFVPHHIERVRPDGMVIDIRGRPLPGGGLVTIYTDITEQRQRELALKELSEALEQRVLERTSELQQREAELAREKKRLELVMNNVPVGISFFNQDLRLELLNRRCSDVMRLPPELTTAGTSFDDIIRLNAERGEYGPGNIEEQIRSRVDIARQNQAHRFERRRPDGSAVEVIGNPTPEGGFVTTYLDVTERARVEAALRASEARFRDFASASSDWFYETDENHRFTYFSDRFTELTGIASEKLIGKTREEFAPGEVAREPEKWAALRATMMRHEPYRDFEYSPHTLGDGERMRHIRIHGMPVFDHDGRFSGYRGTGSDISEIKEAELKLRENEAQLRTILEASPIGIALVDRAQCTLRFCNRRLAEQLGQTADTLIGQSAYGFFFDDRTERQPISDLCCGDGHGDSERQLKRADGSPWWALISARAMSFQGDDCLLIWAYDISELHEAREQMSSMAHHDALTALPNRRFFELAAQRYLARAKRFNTRGALLYFDLDGFKAVNDAHGHAIGDLVLQKISGELRTRLRETDFIARLGGDEFAVLVEDFLSEHTDIRSFARELITIVGSAARTVCTDRPVGASVGVALFDADGPAVEQLMQLADDAMYHAKSLGKNTVCFSDANQQPADAPR